MFAWKMLDRKMKRRLVKSILRQDDALLAHNTACILRTSLRLNDIAAVARRGTKVIELNVHPYRSY
jgi:hypothetical protein